MTEEEKKFKKMINEAWPNERLARLGPQQAELLTRFVAQQEHWDVEKLSNLLLEVETYWPEEIIPICTRVWDSLPQKKNEGPATKKAKPKKKPSKPRA